jgi:hypothetical protein
MKSLELSSGSIVGGKLTIVSPLGRTPWASTYRALMEPNRDLALKAWSTEALAKKEDADELERVRAAVRALPEHWVLSPVVSGFDEEKEIAWSASPLSSTPSLAELVELCPLTPVETAAFLRSLARVLDAAHAAGAPHLALKPTNVFIGPAPTYAVHVGDFGAYVLRRACAHPAAKSASAAWEAPEQAAERAQVGAPADVFSAALLAFFAMTRGSFWASCESPASPHLAALKNEMMSARVPATERARARGVELPEAVDAVFTRALAIAPSARYPSASDFAAAFAVAVGGAAAVATTSESAPAVAAPVPPEVLSPPPPAPAMIAPAQLDAEAVAAAAPEGAPSEPRAPFGQPSMTEAEVAALVPPRSPITAALAKMDRRKLLVFGGAAAAAIVGVGVLAIVLVASSGGKPKPVASTRDVASVASAKVAVEPPPAPTASAPAPPPDPPPEAPLAANESELEIVCEPACDKVAIDGKQHDPSVATVRVKPGSHGVGVARTGYQGEWRKVSVAGGNRATVKFTLTALPEGAVAQQPAVRPAGPGAPPPKKNCGKFLKRCD